MDIRRNFLLLLLLCICSGSAKEMEQPKYETSGFEPVWRLEPLPLKLTQREEKTIAIPMIPKKDGYRIVLKLQCRVHTKRFSGWNHNLGIYVDDNPITALTPFDEFRILNRQRVFSEGEKHTIMTLQDNFLLTIFNDDFENLDQRIKVDRDEKYWYLIDIDDLVTPLLNKTELKLVNRTRFSEAQTEIGYLIISNCEAGYVNEKNLRKKDVSEFDKRPSIQGKTIKRENYSFTLAAAGGMEIKTGDEEYFIEGVFSRPGAGMNRLLCKSDGTPEWKVKISEVTSGGFLLNAVCKDYEFERNIIVGETKIEIRDTFTNLTGDVLGIKIDNVLSPNMFPDNIYLSGMEGSRNEHLCAENPTVFIKQQKSGLGFVAEDDVYRLQLKAKVRNSVVHCSTDNFGLKAGEAYMMEWTLYPRQHSPARREAPLKPFAETPDYWDFINQVRRDWKVNFTIPGHWGGNDGGRRNAFFGGLTWFRSNGAFNGKCYEMPNEEYKDYYRSRMTDPSLKYIPGMEPWELYLHETEFDKFKDSIISDQQGNPVKTYNNWLSGEAREKGYHIYAGFLTRENALFKQKMEAIRFLLDDAEAAGVYLDCFSYFRFLRYHYGEWDGRTVDIDPKNFTVRRKYSDLALVVSPAEEAMVKYVLEKGKHVIANTQPVTRSMNNLKTVRFVEMWNNYSQVCREAHLYTPIGLGYPGYAAKSSHGRGIVSGEWLLADVRGALSAGCLYFYRSVRLADSEQYAYELLDRMYPFTPIEIHPGWLWGEERIITMKSGVFGWHDKSRAQVYLFDKNGQKITPVFKTLETKNKIATQLTIQPGQIAIIERDGSDCRN